MSPGLRIAVFLLVVLFVWGGQHLYVGWRLASLPWLGGELARRLLFVGLGFGVVSYPLGRALRSFEVPVLGVGLEWLGAVWVGALFLLVAAFLVADVATVGGLLGGERVWVVRTLAVCLAVVGTVAGLIGGLSPPRVERLELPVADLADEADGITILMASDLHLGGTTGQGRLRWLVELTQELRPDLIALPGDVIDSSVDAVRSMVPLLAGLQAPLGTFVVLGNHEHYAGADPSRKLLADAGFELLDNGTVEVRPGLVVAGVPDPRGAVQTGAVRADLETTLDGVSEQDVVVLLLHSPEDEERIAQLGVDLLLCGHTHGGQIWPFHLLVRLAYPHLAGVYRVGGMTQVVSRGAGMWGPPMRLLAPADVYLITLRAGDPDHVTAL